MFSSTRKQAQQIARQFLTGHCGLVAWWTLRHAGVLEAIAAAQAEGGKGFDPAAHAGRTNMSQEILVALLDYLSQAGLVAFKKEGVVMTTDGQALFEYEDGVLELIRAYQPVLDMAEHLLRGSRVTVRATGARRGACIGRRNICWIRSKALSGGGLSGGGGHGGEHRLRSFGYHVRDGGSFDACGQRHKRVVGVGIGGDGFAVRRANEAIAKADLEKRLIAVTASPVDVCANTERTFDRIGISRQLWKEINCVMASHFFSEYAARRRGMGSGRRRHWCGCWRRCR